MSDENDKHLDDGLIDEDPIDDAVDESVPTAEDLTHLMVALDAMLRIRPAARERCIGSVIELFAAPSEPRPNLANELLQQLVPLIAMYLNQAQPSAPGPVTEAIGVAP